MKLDTFFEKFDQFADAPDAVAKMRELILESAIRGMLVPQEASDEPASELLKRMASAQAGQGRKQATLPPIGDDAYLQLPPGWEWTRLGNTGRIFNGDSVSESGKTELAKVDEGLPFIATKDVGYGRAALVYDNGLKVPLGDPRFKVARANAVLICAEGGSAGRKIGIADRDICFGNKLFANEVHEGIHHRYVFYVYQAPTFSREFAARMTGIIGGISRGEFLSLPFPLPPLAEQKRIVAKVDELMALCNRLEAQQQERETRHAALARASLARFADAPTPANLGFLFHPSYAIPPADLRKSILTLAVQGKLVSQDPKDEPAEMLVARLMNREPLDNGRRKRSQPDLAFTPDEVPFELPSGWAWARLGNVGETNIGLTYSPQDVSDEGIPVLRASNIQNGKLDFDDLVRVTCEPRRSVMVQEGDLLICARNGSRALVGKVARIEGLREPSAFGAFMAIYRSEVNSYLYHFIRSPLFRQMIDEVNTTTINQITQNNLRTTLAPIPPLAEQLRIVAKVEQLMTLVDALENRLATARTTASHLLAAAVADLTNRDERHVAAAD